MRRPETFLNDRGIYIIPMPARMRLHLTALARHWTAL